MPAVISVENLGKKYLLRHQSERQPYVALRDVLNDGLRTFARRLTGHAPVSSAGAGNEEFWALDDVSFEAHRGDRIGVIGRNGAGKSTLLKILSRIIEPTCGSVRIKGRVASLLEVGTGFHPELTGRENIYLNGAILGMTRAEIRSKFDEIVDFAEIEKFLDTPVKRFSSGMYVRLAFAVAAHLEPEILLVDEVLAVGDVQFQRKCLGKMEDVSAKEGRTVLFVSHNMGAIAQLCQKGILIENGKLESLGSAESAIKRYVLNSSIKEGTLGKSFVGTLSGIIDIQKIRINGAEGSQVLVNSAAHIEIVVDGHCLRQISNFVFSFSIYKDDIRLFTQHDSIVPKILPKGDFKVMVTFPQFVLRPGEYTLAFGGKEASSKDWFYGTYLKYLIVEETWSEENAEINYGLINVKCLTSYRISNGNTIC